MGAAQDFSCKYGGFLGDTANWAANGAYQNLSGAKVSCGSINTLSSLSTRFRLVVWNPAVLNMMIKVGLGFQHCGYTGPENLAKFGISDLPSPPCSLAVSQITLNGKPLIPTNGHLWNTSGGRTEMKFTIKPEGENDTLLMDSQTWFEWVPSGDYKILPTITDPPVAIKTHSPRKSAILNKLRAYDVLGRDYFRMGRTLTK